MIFVCDESCIESTILIWFQIGQQSGWHIKGLEEILCMQEKLLEEIKRQSNERKICIGKNEGQKISAIVPFIVLQICDN